MRLRPKHRLIGADSLLIIGSTKAAAAFILDSLTRQIAGVIIGQVHISRISLVDILAVGVAENFAVDIQSALVGVDAVDNGRPEITFGSVVIGWQLNVLGGVKAEAVNAAIHALLEQIENLILNDAVCRVKLGHT